MQQNAQIEPYSDLSRNGVMTRTMFKADSTQKLDNYVMNPDKWSKSGWRLDLIRPETQLTHHPNPLKPYEAFIKSKKILSPS